MRKLRRWAFNALTLLSLLLCIGTVGVWERSYRHFFGVGWQVHQPVEDELSFFRYDSRSIGVNRGAFTAQSFYRGVADDAWSPSSPRSYHRTYFEIAATPASTDDWVDLDKYERRLRFVGFTVIFPVNRDEKQLPPNGGDFRVAPHTVYKLTLPLWSLTLLFAILPSLSLLRLIRRRRIPPGHCRHCGYNLHANLSGACPECGQPTAPAEPPRV